MKSVTCKWKFPVLKTLLIPGFLFFISCKKETEKPSLEDGRSTVVYDLAGDTGASMGEGAEGKEQRAFYTFLYRFKDGKQIWIKNAGDSARWLKTTEWDLAFTGPYNSEVFLNNGQQQYNPGFEGPASSSIVLFDKPYNQVTEAPSDNAFENSTVERIGWSSFAGSAGWFFYSLSTHIMKAVPNRTYVLKLPDGKFAKLQLVSVYKGNPPAVTDLNWPAPYFTFRYFVQEDGSRDLATP